MPIQQLDEHTTAMELNARIVRRVEKNKIKQKRKNRHKIYANGGGKQSHSNDRRSVGSMSWRDVAPQLQPMPHNSSTPPIQVQLEVPIQRHEYTFFSLPFYYIASSTSICVFCVSPLHSHLQQFFFCFFSWLVFVSNVLALPSSRTLSSEWVVSVSDDGFCRTEHTTYSTLSFRKWISPKNNVLVGVEHWQNISTYYSFIIVCAKIKQLIWLVSGLMRMEKNGGEIKIWRVHCGAVTINCQ